MVSRCLYSFFFIIGVALVAALFHNPDHVARRKSLIEGEKQLRFSSNIQLSEEEQRVDQYLKQLQKQVKVESPTVLADPRAILSKDARIYKTPLMRLIARMPKGGVLHIHSSAMGDLHWLLEKAIEEPHCYIYLGKGDGKLVTGAMRFFQEPPSLDWKPLRMILERSATKQEAIQHLQYLVTLNPKHAGSAHTVWGHFEDCFKRIKGLVQYQPLRKEYLKHVLTDYVKQNVQYLEVRSSLSPLYDLEGNPLTDAEHLQLLADVVKEMQAIDPAFSMKVIQAGSRHATLEQMEGKLERYAQLSQQFPRLLVGFDIVNQEDVLKGQLDYLPALLSFKERYAEINPSFFFHAGESTERENENIVDSILLGTRRIGHGLRLAYHPHLMGMVKNHHVCVEVCPISNQVLGFVGDLRHHPAQVLMNFGIPIVLSPDDPGIMRYSFNGDFFAACVHWQLDLKDLKQISMNSIIYSAMNQQEKSQALSHWERRWKKFIHWASEQQRLSV